VNVDGSRTTHQAPSLSVFSVSFEIALSNQITKSKMSSLVVMGVAGCGKSSLGGAVAGALGWPLVEGDDFHPSANVAKMKSGVPLTDADRRVWLTSLAQELAARTNAVLTCSALKRSYREQLRAASPDLRFVFLDLTETAARERVAKRPTHLFPPALVASQFATLERPDGEDGVLRVDATLAPDLLLAQVLQWLAAPPPTTTSSTTKP
jgi:gluconokinase